MQKSAGVANAQLDAIETAIGASPIMKIFDGTKPAATTDADAGTVLATIALPSDWMAAASGRSKAKSGTWQDTSADNTGTADYWRIYDNAGTTCHLQGTLTAAGGGGELIVDNINFAAGQQFTINTFTITMP